MSGPGVTLKFGRLLSLRPNEAKTIRLLTTRCPFSSHKISNIHRSYASSSLLRPPSCSSMGSLFSKPSSVFEDTLIQLQQGHPGNGGEDKWAREYTEGVVPTSFQCLDYYYDNKTSLMRIFGTTKHGTSIAVNVQGCFLFCKIPRPKSFSDTSIPAFQDYLNDLSIVSNAIRHIKSSSQSHLHIIFNSYDALVDIRDSRCLFGNLDWKVGAQLRGLKDIHSAFMQHFDGIPFLSKVVLEPTTYQLVQSEDKQSHCQIEVNVNRDNLLISSSPTGLDSKPLRILSFDIECPASTSGLFPKSSQDPIVQISNMVSLSGKEDTPFIRNVFTLKSCDHIPGAQVISFDSESDMLKAWRNFVLNTDPDIVTGYNVRGFDTPYIVGRAAALGLDVREFACLGRNKGPITDLNATSKIPSETVWGGRLMLDVLLYIRRYQNLSSNKLGNAAHIFLGESKELDDYSLLHRLQMGTSVSRKHLALYCLKDSYLVLKLMHKLRCVSRCFEDAREGKIPFNSLLTSKAKRSGLNKKSNIVSDGMSLTMPLTVIDKVSTAVVNKF